MSLPLACGTTLASIPAQVPYLPVPADAQRKAEALLMASQRPAGRHRVGG